MADYSALKAAVQAVVKTNGNQEITGANMQATLLSIIDSLGNGYQFMGVATPSTTPPSSPDYNIAYIAGAGSYTNFGTSVVIPPTNIAIFKYDGSWACEQVTVENGGVFDITAYNNNTTYADLAAALGTNGANVPQSLRKGGMSVKFVCSSDNKYVQYRYIGTATTGTPNPFLNTSNWRQLEDAGKLVKLVGMGTISEDTTGVTSVGQCYYNTSNKNIYRCISIHTPFTSTDFEIIPKFEGAIYTFGDKLYSWNGTDLYIIASKDGFLNVNYINNTNVPYLSLMDAISNISEEFKCAGLIVTYLLSDGWHTAKFNGVSLVDWNNAEYWEDETKKLDRVVEKTDNIIIGSTQSIDDSIELYDNEDNLVGRVDKNECAFKNLKIINEYGETKPVETRNEKETQEPNDSIEIENNFGQKIFIANEEGVRVHNLRKINGTPIDGGGVNVEINNITNSTTIVKQMIDELISTAITSNGYIDAEGVWQTGVTSKIIRINPLHTYRITTNDGGNILVGWLKDYSEGVGVASEYASLYTLLKSSNSENICSVTDANYLYWIYTPQSDITSVLDLGEISETHYGETLDQFILSANKLAAYQMNVYGGIQKEDYNTISPMTTNEEKPVRIPAFFAYNMSVLLATGYHQPWITGHSKTALENRIHNNVMALVNGHIANTASGWGHTWQSPYWAYSVAASYLILPYLFSSSEIELIKAMVSNEKTYIISSRLTTQELYWKNTQGTEINPGDTRAEECGWLVSLIGAYLMLFPNASDHETIEDLFVRLNIIACSTPQDRTSGKIINGYDLSLLEGSNYTNNYDTVNHTIIHPQYQIAYETSTFGVAGVMARYGYMCPIALMFNKDKIYNALTSYVYDSTYREGGGTVYQNYRQTIYYPEGSDWSNILTVTFAGVDLCTFMLGALPSQDSIAWANLHLKKVQWGQSRFKDGRIYQNGEHSYGHPGCEVNAAENLSVSLMLSKFNLNLK